MVDQQDRDVREDRLEVTPAAAGYRWPAEWDRHSATWLAWPRNPHTWPGKFEIIPPIYAEWVRMVARFEPVRLLAGSGPPRDLANQLLADVANVEIFDWETNDSWIRDFGPIFVTKPGGSKGVVDWQYNAWGSKYSPYDLDNAVPSRVANHYGFSCFHPSLVLEGGAIEGNGEGVLLTTESCLLNPTRNGSLTRGEIEQALRDYLGVEDIYWLAGGDFAGDDTDGHIDQLVRFVDPQTVVAAICTDPSDDNFEVLQFLYQQLQAIRLPNGTSLNIELLPIPQPKFCQDQRLPASYCNFTLHNGGVIVPQFDDPADAIALERLAALFPERSVVGSPALDLVWGLGAFHCLSQQEPADA
jgi:agmatine deiminase